MAVKLRVLVDANVALDVLAKREPRYLTSVKYKHPKYPAAKGFLPIGGL